MGTKWCVHATEDNMKTLIMCVIVPFASETDDFADNFAVEEYEFEQEAKTSLIDAGWKKAQYGDKQYKSGEKSLKAGTKIADTPRMGAFKNSMKKISKATHHFKEAKARYLTKKGCHRVKQCKTRHCSKKEMLLEKKKKKSAKKGKKKKGKKKKGKKKKHGAWHVRGEEPHPWIRHIPCGKKVCRFVTKCDVKKVKMYERKQKKEEAAIAKKYEAMDWKRRVAWKKNAPERKAKAKALKKKGKKKKGKKGK